MSESRNSVTNSLDAESGVSVKSRVSRGRRLLEVLRPSLRKRRLEDERRKRNADEIEARWQQLIESMDAETRAINKKLRRYAKEAEKRRMAKALIDAQKAEISGRASSSRRTYRRIKEKV